MPGNSMSCKGCGAPIGLAPGQTRGVCQFCGTPFTADRENLDVMREEMEQRREDEKLRQNRQQLNIEQQKIDYQRQKLEYEKDRFNTAKKTTGGCSSCSNCFGGCFAVILLVAIFGGLMFFLFKEPIMEYVNELILYAEVSDAKGKFYTTLDDIPKESLDKMNSKAKEMADDSKGTLYGSWKYDGDAEFVGNYLVSYNDGTGNELYCVFRSEYENDPEELYYTVYKCYRFKYIYPDENGTVKYPGEPEDLGTQAQELKDNSKKSSTVYGFLELSDIYDNYIATIQKANKITSSGIVYMPEQ